MQRGMSLIEVVVFIIVLGIAFAGLLILYNQVTRTSVDPMIRKQALALASSLLEEIQLHAYTYCDPDEPDVYTANAALPAQCGSVASHVEAIGPENFGAGAETRYSATNRFDNVSDYHDFRMGSGQAAADIRTADNTAIAALADYSLVVSVQATVASELGASVPAGEALRITVTATHVPTAITVSLSGYRTLYAPNSP
jgi:MSHA pilin protein MshD